MSAAITLTEQAVPTPTLAPTSTPGAAAPERTLTPLEDGSTLFVDERAGYEVTVPVGWLTVGVNKQEFLDAFTLTPDIQNYLLSIQNKDPNIFRLFALDMQDGHFQNGFFTNMNFIWDEQGDALLKNDDGLKAGIAQLAGTAPEPEILSTTLSTTSSGIPLSMVETKYTMRNSSNVDIIIFQKQVAFNAKTGTVAITVSTVEGLKDSVFATFDAMLETIKVSP